VAGGVGRQRRTELGDQRFDHADGAPPGRVGGQDRLDDILKEGGGTEQAPLRAFFDVCQFGLPAGQRIKGREILIQSEHPSDLACDVRALGLAELALHLDAHAIGRTLDPHLDDAT
jgi:hypothetical protein